MKDEKFIERQLEKLGYWSKLYRIPNYFGKGETKLARIALPVFHKSGIKNLLELGCGQGRDAVFFAEKGFGILATDFSEDAVNFVNQISIKKNIPLATKKLDLLEDFDFDASFDGVYSNLALQFFDKIELDQIFKKISSLLDSGQYFIFSTKKPGDKYHNVGTKISPDAFQTKGITRYFFDNKTLESLIIKFFKIESSGYETHENLDGSVSAWWYFITRKI